MAKPPGGRGTHSSEWSLFSGALDSSQQPFGNVIQSRLA